MKIIQIGLRIIVFLILVVLAINNMQIVDLNFFGLYIFKAPLIITLAIFTLGGLAIGLLLGFLKNWTLRAQISALTKQVKSAPRPN